MVIGMKQIKYVWLLSLLSILACNKQDAPDCFKSTGAIVERGELRLVNASFNSIEVRQNIQLKLVQDTFNFVLISAGKNLIPKISTEIQGENLIIKNNNRCNWVRTYEAVPTVEVHFKSLRYLRCFGFGKVWARDTIRGHALDILHYGASQLDLPLHYYSLFYDGDQVGTATLSGRLNILYYSSQKFNQLHAPLLQTLHFEGLHKSERDASIHCTESLTVQMENTGNVLVSGNPIISVSGKGKGKVLLK
jgi:hypothetical protein